MKKRKLIKCLILIGIVIVIIVAMIIGFELRIKDGGLYVGNSITTPYSYTIHGGYIVLEKYHGNEEVVELPNEILGIAVTKIGYECLAWNETLKVVRLNENLETIGVRAFWRCTGLHEITGGCVKVIDGRAFDECVNLVTVDLGEGIEKIENGAFADCISLKSIVRQDRLEFIGDYAFSNSGLETFVFGKDVIVENEALAGTPWMRNQTEEFVIYGDGRMIGYNGTDETVYVPEGVKTLVGGCFEDTTAKEIYVSNTVTVIDEFTFLECTDIRVYIPDSVLLMGDEEGRWAIKNDDVDITIITTQDSYAHKYAIEHDIPVEIVEGW